MMYNAERKEAMREIKLHNSDCIEFLSSLDDEGVGFTFYDPPYNIGKDYGEYKDDMSDDDYAEWMKRVVGEVRRVSKRGFAVYVGAKLTRMFYEIIPDAHLIPVHKRAIGAMEGNYFLQYHSLFVVGKPLVKCKDLWDDIRLPGEGYYFREERFGHPGQTAEALVAKVLYHFTQVGDVVCDPFLGIGTSAVVSLRMSRDFVGCEISPAYYEIAHTRIREMEMQPMLIETTEGERLMQEEMAL